MRGKRYKWEIMDNGCIISTSHKTNQDGYLRIRHPNSTITGRKPLIMAHRYVWEAVNDSKIPDGYEVDHVCRNRACVNPIHLQVLDKRSHKVKTNKERYLERKLLAKSYWHRNKCTGTELGGLFGVSFSISCRWIREWKGVETIQ